MSGNVDEHPKQVRYYKIDRDNMQAISHTLENLAELFEGKEGYEDLAAEITKLRASILHRFLVQGEHE